LIQYIKKRIDTIENGDDAEKLDIYIYGKHKVNYLKVLRGNRPYIITIA